MAGPSGWKSFEQLVKTPSVGRKTPRRSASAKKRRSITKSLPARGDDAGCQIDDASDEEGKESQTVAVRSSAGTTQWSENCSAATIQPSEGDKRRNSESDIEDVSEDDPDLSSDSCTSSSDSDCVSIHCKRKQSMRLSFVTDSAKRPRITDDVLATCSAIERVNVVKPSNATVSKELSPIGARKMPSKGVRGVWKDLNESFRETLSASDSSPGKRWKQLGDTFPIPPEENIENTGLTPEEQTNLQPTEAGTSFYEPSAHPRSFMPKISAAQRKKDSPLYRLQTALNEKITRQNYWLHERQSGLGVPMRVVKLESIGKEYGRVRLSYRLPCQQDPSDTVNHYVYLDPSEKQLNGLHAGTTVELDIDDHECPPHQLSRTCIVHLGVCKIRPISLTNAE